ncbi:MAG TPA: sugar ABC transporter permease [Candidatus Gastranaerophilales bacterium]|nr:sugar ABC transporter permease [Candidatus Gastranaerophilales bacterium]
MDYKKFFASNSWWAVLFILPAFLGVFIFIIIPVFMSFGLGFVKWNLISPPQFIGLKNYIELFSDEIFYKVLWNTFYYAFITAVFSILIPLVLAYALDRKLKGAAFFKAAYFLPYVTPMIVIAIVWTWMFDPNYGILNWLLGIGDSVKWLYDEKFAMPALIIVSIWKNIGYNMIIFLAGLQAIPESVNEACELDGATGFRRFFLVTLPLLTPTLFFVSIMTVISSFQVFDLIFLMTEGGPQNSTMIMVYWLFKQAFEYFNIGKASAIAYVLFVIILLLTLIQWKTRKKWVLNE